MNFTSKCSRCGSTIHLLLPWMYPVYSCGCGPLGLLFSFSTPKQAVQAEELREPEITMDMSPYDDLTPKRIERMYSQFREESIEHARTCGLCKAIAEQGLVCTDLEQLRLGRDKWLALMIVYPQDKRR